MICPECKREYEESTEGGFFRMAGPFVVPINSCKCGHYWCELPELEEKT